MLSKPKIGAREAKLSKGQPDGTAKLKPSIYQLKITLLEIDPPIWRRFQVPSTIPLCCLHDALQAVLGWTDSHLHQLEKDGLYWGVPDDDGFDGDVEVIDESRVPVSRVLRSEGDTLIYVYDFGDNWRHEVVLEKILPSDFTLKPVCIGGKRRCPPEDVGGPSGYEEFLDVIFQPGHEEFAHFRGWAGGKFQAEEFDLEAVNKLLGRMRWPVRHKRQKSCRLTSWHWRFRAFTTEKLILCFRCRSLSYAHVTSSAQ